jgi:hypothetical protein
MDRGDFTGVKEFTTSESSHKPDPPETNRITKQSSEQKTILMAVRQHFIGRVIKKSPTGGAKP